MRLALPSGAVHGAVVGRGPPLVFLHGGPGLDHRYFRPWVDSLADVRTLVFFDMRGCGASPSTTERALGVDEWADDVLSVLDVLGYERADLIGHSFGACVALQAAAMATERVSRLLLIAPPGSANDSDRLAHVLARGTPEQIKSFLNPKSPVTDQELAHQWNCMLPLYFAQEQALEVAERLRRDQLSVRAFHEGLASLQTTNLRESFRAVRSRLLLCSGREDWLSRPEASHDWRSLLPEAETFVFERSGHFPFIEENALFLQVVRSFLSGHGSAQHRNPSS